MSLFGRGGKTNTELNLPTEPSPLDFGGDKSELRKKAGAPIPQRPMGPSGNNYGGGFANGSYGSSSRTESYQSVGAGQKHRADTVNDFSDMQTTDGLTDQEIRNLRMQGYNLSNMEREFDIRHKNDFNNIIKIMMIAFAVVLLIVIIVIAGVIAYTSIKSGGMTETGIINGILQFIADVMKIGLS